jgi:hypothetical protein
MKERRKNNGKPAAERVGGLRAVGDMLPSVGGTAFRRFGFVQSSVVSRWREIVGPRYADVSAPESIRFPAGKHKDGVLTLMVDSAHAPMMQHVAPAIMERVNRFFGYGAVARLTIRQGQVTPPAPRMAPPSLRLVPAAMGDSLRAIGDPELRACLEALAGAVAASTGAPNFEEDDRCA